MLPLKNINKIIATNAIFDGVSNPDKEKLRQLLAPFKINLKSKPTPLKIAKDMLLLVSKGELEITLLDAQNNVVLTQKIQAGEVWVGARINNTQVQHVRFTKSTGSSLFVLRLSDLFYQISFKEANKRITANLGLQFDHPKIPHRDHIILLNKEELQNRTLDMQRYITVLIIVLTVYIFFQHYFSDILVTTHGHPLHVDIIVLAFSSSLILWLIGNSHFPPAVFGLTLTNTKVTIKEGLIGAAVLMVLVTLLKWILITHYPVFANLSLFDTDTVLARYQNLYSKYFIGIFAYIFLSVPMQELAIRVATQGFLQQIFYNRKSMWQPIILTNLIFGSMHVVISPYVAIVVVIPGLYWSWLFAKHHNFIGVWVSHAVVGAYTLYVLDVFSLVLKSTNHT